MGADSADSADSKDQISTKFQNLQVCYQRLEGKEEDRYWFVSTARSMQPVNEILNSLRRESMKGELEPPVLITGALGCGHDGVARMIRAASRRGADAWIAVNCAEWDAEVLRADLFGYEAGAYQDAAEGQPGLVEMAPGGTLYLKELSALDSESQELLVQMIRTGRFKRLGGTQDIAVDIRVIASTHEDIKQKVQSGQFSSQLLELFAPNQVHLPELRNRSEDILPLAIQFARKAFRAHMGRFEGFHPDAEKTLLSHNWPGNLEELYLMVQKIALLWREAGAVTSNGLGLQSMAQSLHVSTKDHLRLVPGIDLKAEGELNYTSLKKRWSDSFEKEYLKEALNRNHGNVSAAAREAKLDRSNFLRLLRRHSLKAEAFRPATEEADTAARADSASRFDEVA